MAKKEQGYKERKEIYIALEDKIDFIWDKRTEVKEVIELWEGGISLHDMSKKMKRPPDDVFVLLYDLALDGKIESRSGTIYGDMV